MVLDPRQIHQHLKEYLPRLSDRFARVTDQLAEIAPGDPQILRVTQAAHGKSIGDTVVITRAILNNPVVSALGFEDPDGQIGIRFTVGTAHDLTQDYTETVNLDGFADGALNGEFDLHLVPSRTSFEILTDAAVPTVGFGELLEYWETGIQGVRTVDDVLNVNVYEINLDGLPEFPIGGLDTFRVADQFRIDLVDNFQRVEDKYTKQGPDSAWAYLIMNESVLSKDRIFSSDAQAANTAQTTQRLRMLSSFSVNVILPTTNDIGAADAVISAWTDIETDMVQALSGFTADDQDGNTQYVISYTGHGSMAYNTAYYGHVYEFEHVGDLILDDGFTVQFIRTRSARDAEMSLGEKEADANLDGN